MDEEIKKLLDSLNYDEIDRILDNPPKKKIKKNKKN